VDSNRGVAGPQSQVSERPPHRAESPNRNRPPEPQPGVFLFLGLVGESDAD